MSKPVKLIRCPRCGGFGRPVRIGKSSDYIIACKTTPGCRQVMASTYLRAAEIWNDAKK